MDIIERDTVIGLIGKVLRSETEDLMHAPLPEQWSELIDRLNELELEKDKPEPQSG
jgi:hypothetical protein